MGENTGKMVAIGETSVGGDEADVVGGTNQALCGDGDATLLNEPGWGLAKKLAEDAAEMVDAQVAEFCQFGDR